MEGDYPFRTGRGSTGNLESYGDPFDPANPHYGKDVFATSSMIAGGMAPQDGWMYRGTDMPAVPQGQKGYYTMVNTGPGLRTMNDGILDEGAQDTTWRFVAEQENTASPSSMEEALRKQAPAADPSGKTIYNDWDTYRAQARAEPESNLFSPGVLNQQDLVGLDRRQQMSALYPAAWQESGVQKVIGPNGTNIAPELESQGLFAKFRENNIQPSDYADFPSMMDQLLKAGTITQKEHDFLGDLTVAKKPDQSFAQLGAQGGGGLKGMMGYK